MAFDVGCVIGNFLMAFIISSMSDKHQDRMSGTDPSAIESLRNRRRWILEAAEQFWERFSTEMRRLELSSTISRRHAKTIDNWLKELWVDSLGFSAVSMVRLTIGQLHYPPLDALPPDAISDSSHRILRLAEGILTHRPSDMHNLMVRVQDEMA